MALTGMLLQRTIQAIVAAYSREELRVLLAVCLEQDLDALVADKAFTQQVYDLVQLAEKTGNLPALLHCLCGDRPQNQELAAIYAGSAARNGDSAQPQPWQPSSLPPPVVLAHAAAPPAGRESASLWCNVPEQPNYPLVGRDAALDTLITKLTGDNAPDVAFCGQPGVGKTALAVALVNDKRIAASFSDGVLWANVGLQPNTATILNQWATALGADTTDTSSPEQRAAQVSALLGSRRVLVVLDDVWELEAAKLLKFSNRSVVHLLTTGAKVVAEEFATKEHSYTLTELDETRAFALLQAFAPEVCAADETAARNLVRVVGYLPLAITVLGGYLRSSGAHYFSRQRAQSLAKVADPAIRLALAAERLGADTQGRVTLADTLGLGLHGLPPPVQKAFFALGAFAPKPARFDLDAASTVTGAEMDALVALLDRNLVEIDAAEKMAMHPLLSDLARSQMPEEAAMRHHAFYFDIVKRDDEDWQTIESEYEQVRWALERLPPHDPSLPAWCNALGTYWWRRGLFEQQFHWTQQAIAVVRAAGNTQQEGELLNSLGHACSQSGRLDEAQSLFEQSLPLRRQAGDTAGVATVLNNLGRVSYYRGDYARSFDYFEQALPYFEQTQDVKELGTVLGNIGAVHNMLGNYEKALHYLDLALPLRKQAADREGESATCFNFGKVYANLGNHRRALSYFEQSLQLDRTTGMRSDEAGTWHRIGQTYLALGEPGRALYHFEHALALREELHDVDGQAETRAAIAEVTAALQRGE